MPGGYAAGRRSLFFFQAEDGIRGRTVTGVQTCALPISGWPAPAPAPANLVVTLPSDARLFVDGHETKSVSGQRLLTTPDLQPGRTYSYTLREIGRASCRERV